MPIQSTLFSFPCALGESFSFKRKFKQGHFYKPLTDECFKVANEGPKPMQYGTLRDRPKQTEY